MNRRNRIGRRRLPAACLLLATVVAACGSQTAPSTTPAPNRTTTPTRTPAPAIDIYAATRAGMLTPQARQARSLVYVPNVSDGTVTEIDPHTYRVVRTIAAGALPQHVVPSWDLRTLWVNNNHGDSLTPLDPRTGRRAGPNVSVRDPYNLYFSLDGSTALVMAESERSLDLYDPHTWTLRARISLSRCAGLNHADFSADGTTMLVSCEFAHRLVAIDLRSRREVREIELPSSSAPQDVKLDPDGSTFYVADMNANGVWLIDARTLRRTGFLRTGPEAHGLYVSRDGTRLYVVNRGGQLVSTTEPFPHTGEQGSISVISFTQRKVVATWTIRGGGTPDMGNVSADGATLWLAGRRDDVVYVISTANGSLLARIRVGRQPHGLCVWPQPGQHSLGHTGVMR